MTLETGRQTTGEQASEGEADEAATARGAEPWVDPASSDAPVSSAEYSVAFTPRNVALGLAIVAGLVALVARRRRRSSRRSANED
jgi:hypothetical protein